MFVYAGKNDDQKSFYQKRTEQEKKIANHRAIHQTALYSTYKQLLYSKKGSPMMHPEIFEHLNNSQHIFYRVRDQNKEWIKSKMLIRHCAHTLTLKHNITYTLYIIMIFANCHSVVILYEMASKFDCVVFNNLHRIYFSISTANLLSLSIVFGILIARVLILTSW